MPSTPRAATSALPTAGPPVTRFSDAAGHAGLVQDLGQQHARPRRRLGRLEHDGVARHERRADRTGGERGREVEGRDHAEHAVRAQHRRVVVLAGLRRLVGLERVVLDEPVAVVRDQVGALLDLADRLDPVLAHLERDDGAEEHDALADQVGGALQDPRALRVRRRAPVVRRRPGRGHGVGDVGRRRLGVGAERLRVVRRVRDVEGARTARAGGAADDQLVRCRPIAGPRPPRHRRQRSARRSEASWRCT